MIILRHTFRWHYTSWIYITFFEIVFQTWQPVEQINIARNRSDGHLLKLKLAWWVVDHNSPVSWWIFTLLVPMEIGMNTGTLQRSYKIYNFTLTVSPHYLIKLKTQNSTFWSQSSQYFITEQQEWVYELSELSPFGLTHTFPQVFDQNFYLQNSTFYLN